MSTIQIEPAIDLARFMSYNDLTGTMFFDGSQDSGFLAGSLHTISIKLTSSVHGTEAILTKVIRFQELPLVDEIVAAQSEPDHQGEATEAQLPVAASNEISVSGDTHVETSAVSMEINQEGRVVITFGDPLRNPE